MSSILIAQLRGLSGSNPFERSFYNILRSLGLNTLSILVIPVIFLIGASFSLESYSSTRIIYKKGSISFLNSRFKV